MHLQEKDERLVSCPWCGDPPVLCSDGFGGHWVACDNGALPSESGRTCPAAPVARSEKETLARPAPMWTREQAIEKWNKGARRCLYGDEETWEEAKVGENKIVVPEGMRCAAIRAASQCGWQDGIPEAVYVSLEAALHWLSDNPIVPTREQCDSIYADSPYSDIEDYQNRISSQWTWAEWQRRMFLAPEPEVPEAIKELLWTHVPKSDEHNDPVSCHNTLVLSAYLRGKEAK